MQKLAGRVSKVLKDVKIQLAAVAKASSTDAHTVPNPASSGSTTQQGSELTVIEQLLAEEEQKAAVQQAKKQKQKAKKQRQREQQQQRVDAEQQQLQQQHEEEHQPEEQQQQLEEEHQPEEEQQQPLSEQQQQQQDDVVEQSSQLVDKQGQQLGKPQVPGQVDSLADAFIGLGAEQSANMSSAASLPPLQAGTLAETEADKDEAKPYESMPDCSSNNAGFLQELFCCPLSKVIT